MSQVIVNEQLKTLKSFIDSEPDSRELTRALAVKLVYEGYAYRAIVKILNVSYGFISKYKQAFEKRGIEGIKLAYQGAKSYLDKQQKEEIMQWMTNQETWSVPEIERYVIEEYDVVFKSLQSYYTLLHEAQKSWQKSQKINPRQEPELVKKKSRNC